MVVYKFGGASVKDADSVRNLTKIVTDCIDDKIIVVSAMDKTTRALEKLVNSYYKAQNDLWTIFNDIKNFHFSIIEKLVPDSTHSIYNETDRWFLKLQERLLISPSLCFDYDYDQIVSFGEIFSTVIVSQYLKFIEYQHLWVDIRKVIRTDNTYREAKINWELSEEIAKNTFLFQKYNSFVTQGFIASTTTDTTTTLGKEGSDFTAATLAFLLNAEKVVIWKDVDGVYNADPKRFPNPQKLDKISFHEAIELAYYGATVIHPKTIKPLQNKQIPLYVKSFIYPQNEGTLVKEFQVNDLPKMMPIFILKDDQLLISILPTDFSFIAEDNLSKIFALFAKYHIRINLMQNAAISFSACVDNVPEKIKPVIKELQKQFKVLYNDNLQLVTIRHYTLKAVEEVIQNKEILVQQKSRFTARFVVRNANSV